MGLKIEFSLNEVFKLIYIHILSLTNFVGQNLFANVHYAIIFDIFLIKLYVYINICI